MCRVVGLILNGGADLLDMACWRLPLLLLLKLSVLSLCRLLSAARTLVALLINLGGFDCVSSVSILSQKAAEKKAVA